MNVYSGSKKTEERILSNFASTPFKIEISGQTFHCGSVEGFWQGLKCKGDRRLFVFAQNGMYAKVCGAGKNINQFEITGKVYTYGGDEHKELIKEALRQKLLQNANAAKALRESTGTITHYVPGASKPVIKMEKLLMQLRKELYGH